MSETKLLVFFFFSFSPFYWGSNIIKNFSHIRKFYNFLSTMLALVYIQIWWLNFWWNIFTTHITNTKWLKTFFLPRLINIYYVSENKTKRRRRRKENGNPKMYAERWGRMKKFIRPTFIIRLLYIRQMESLELHMLVCVIQRYKFSHPLGFISAMAGKRNVWGNLLTRLRNFQFVCHVRHVSWILSLKF